jgi:hypothetical protein
MHKGSTEPAKTAAATITPKVDREHPMQAVQWAGKEAMTVQAVPRPLITDPVSDLPPIQRSCY